MSLSARPSVFWDFPAPSIKLLPRKNPRKRPDAESERLRAKNWRANHPAYVPPSRRNKSIRIPLTDEQKRERALVRQEKRRKENPEKFAAQTAKRRAAKKSAMPGWIEAREIQEFYIRCRQITQETGVEHHVDHIVPLQSPIVCGLHVPWNLQIIPGIENRKKQNSSWPDMP